MSSSETAWITCSNAAGVLEQASKRIRNQEIILNFFAKMDVNKRNMIMQLGRDGSGLFVAAIVSVKYDTETDCLTK